MARVIRSSIQQVTLRINPKSKMTNSGIKAPYLGFGI
jgi:hypothetical protein